MVARFVVAARSIDPVAGTIGSSTSMGVEPSHLALSDDGQYLYAALNDVYAVRRMHVPSRAPGLQFALGTAPVRQLPCYAAGLEVPTGNPNSVAVLRYPNTQTNHNNFGLAIYDDGVQRPKIAMSST
jgi:hypothetical protein